MSECGPNCNHQSHSELGPAILAATLASMPRVKITEPIKSIPRVTEMKGNTSDIAKRLRAKRDAR